MLKNEIIEKAKKICAENHISEYPVNIVGLCERFGISVYQEYLPDDVSGFIVAQEEPLEKYDSKQVIVVNLSDCASRRRFTIAHELAHYILHKKPDDALYAHRDAGQNGGMEQEANIFASNLLMPEDLVRSALKQQGEAGRKLFDFEKIEFISGQFAVSRPAAQVRLEQLRLI